MHLFSSYITLKYINKCVVQYNKSVFSSEKMKGITHAIQVVPFNQGTVVAPGETGVVTYLNSHIHI